MDDILDGANSDSVKNGEELQPLSTYIDNREKMIEQAFSVLKGKALYNIIPQSLKNVPVEVLKADALIVLLGMSRKRILATIEDENLSSSSDSESDSSDSDDDDNQNPTRMNSKENSVNPVKRCVSESTSSSDSSDSSEKELLEDLIQKQIKGMKEKLEKRGEPPKKLKKKKEPKKKKPKKQRKKKKADSSSSSSSETDSSADEADDGKIGIFADTNSQKKKKKRKKRKADSSLSESDNSADEANGNKIDIAMNSQKKKKKRKKKKVGSSSSSETETAITNKGELADSEVGEKNADKKEGKSLMEILELEMRAKLIRAVLAKNKKVEFDENGELVIPPSSDEETEKLQRISGIDENISPPKMPQKLTTTLTKSVSESLENNVDHFANRGDTQLSNVERAIEKDIRMDIFSEDEVAAPKIEKSVYAQKQMLKENHVEYSGVVERPGEPSKMEEKSRAAEHPTGNHQQSLESNVMEDTEGKKCVRMEKSAIENCAKMAVEECANAPDPVSKSNEIELSEGEINDSENEDEKRVTNFANPPPDRDSGELTSESETEIVNETKMRNENEDTLTRRSVELDHIVKFSEPSENLDSDDEFSKDKMARNAKLIDKSNAELFQPKEKSKRKKNAGKDLIGVNSSMDEEALLAQLEELKRAAMLESGESDAAEVKPKKKKRKAKKKSSKPKNKSKKSEESSSSSEEKFPDSGDEDKESFSIKQEEDAQPTDWAQRWLESKNVKKAMATSMIYSDMKKKIKEAKAKGLISTKTLIDESAIPQRIRSSSGKKKKKKSRK